MRSATALFSLLGFLAAPAQAIVITLDEFTGDNMQMQATIDDLATGGIKVNFVFTAASQYTGDITGVWLGVDDASFNPSQILASDVVVLGLPSGVSYVVTIGDSITDLGFGVNLTGGAGYIVQFDLDLGLRQVDTGANDLISSLTFNVNRAGLLAAHVDAAGARVMSTNGPEGSSKLAGGITQVPEPGSLALLGAGLLGLGLLRRREVV